MLRLRFAVSIVLHLYTDTRVYVYSCVLRGRYGPGRVSVESGERSELSYTSSLLHEKVHKTMVTQDGGYSGRWLHGLITRRDDCTERWLVPRRGGYMGQWLRGVVVTQRGGYMGGDYMRWWVHGTVVTRGVGVGHGGGNEVGHGKGMEAPP